MAGSLVLCIMCSILTINDVLNVDSMCSMLTTIFPRGLMERNCLKEQKSKSYCMFHQTIVEF